MHVQSVLQGIHTPLVPNTAIAKVLAAPTPTANTATEKDPKSSTQNVCCLCLPFLLSVCLPSTFTHVQSVLQGIDAPLVPNTAVAKVLGAAPAANPATEKAPAPKPAGSTSGRKLLQRGGGSSGGGSRNDRANNWSAMNTQSAIRAAASGRAPSSYATASGRRNAANANRRCTNCVNWN